MASGQVLAELFLAGVSAALCWGGSFDVGERGAENRLRKFMGMT